jgi:hypothetical protein
MITSEHSWVLTNIYCHWRKQKRRNLSATRDIHAVTMWPWSRLVSLTSLLPLVIWVCYEHDLAILWLSGLCNMYNFHFIHLHYDNTIESIKIPIYEFVMNTIYFVVDFTICEIFDTFALLHIILLSLQQHNDIV